MVTNYGEEGGGLQNGKGGVGGGGRQVKFYPYKKRGGGGRKSVNHAEGGHKKC